MASLGLPLPAKNPPSVGQNVNNGGSSKIPLRMAKVPSQNVKIQHLSKSVRSTLEAARQALMQAEHPLEQRPKIEQQLEAAGINPAWLSWWMERYTQPQSPQPTALDVLTPQKTRTGQGGGARFNRRPQNQGDAAREDRLDLYLR